MLSTPKLNIKSLIIIIILKGGSPFTMRNLPGNIEINKYGYGIDNISTVTIEPIYQNLLNS